MKKSEGIESILSDEDILNNEFQREIEIMRVDESGEVKKKEVKKSVHDIIQGDVVLGNLIGGAFLVGEYWEEANMLKNACLVFFQPVQRPSGLVLDKSSQANVVELVHSFSPMFGVLGATAGFFTTVSYFNKKVIAYKKLSKLDMLYNDYEHLKAVKLNELGG